MQLAITMLRELGNADWWPPAVPAQAFEPFNLQPGQRVLIHAGAGGVGSHAIQASRGCLSVCSKCLAAYLAGPGSRALARELCTLLVPCWHTGLE